MSTSRVQAIPAGSRKVVQSLKEIVNYSEAEIYATLKDCNMDPDEAVNRLLSQDPFHEVKSKREKKKEDKDNSEYRARGANNSSTQRGKNGADRQLGRVAAAPYNASEPPLHEKSTYKKENGSTPYPSYYLSSAPAMSGNNRSRGTSCLSDGASAEHKGSMLETVDGMPPVVQPASEYQSSWVGITGQMSMADIVRMGIPHNKASNAPNASQLNVQDPSITESLHNQRFPVDHAPKFHQSAISSAQHLPAINEWPSTEKPDPGAPADVISFQEYIVDSNLHPEASGVPFDSTNHHSEAEEVREREDDNVESSEGNDLGSVSISSRKVPENDSRGASLFENELYKSMGSNQSDAPDFERREDEEVGASVSSITRNLRRLSVEKDDRGFPSEGDAPSIVIPDHLQVQTADCSHLSFGSFGSGMSAAYSSGTMTSVPGKTNLVEGPREADISSAAHLDTGHSEYYIDDSLRNRPNGPSAVSYDTSSASQSEELRSESAEVAHGDQYPFRSSNPGYTLDDAQRLNANFNETSSHMQNLAPFSNVMPPYTDSMSSTLLTGNVHPTRVSDLHYLPFPASHLMSTKYGNPVSSIGVAATSMSEALKCADLSLTQPAQQLLSGTSVSAGPPLPQHIALHPYSQPTLPLAPFANMIGYPFLTQSYSHMPSAFEQPFAGSSAYHQSLAAMLPQYKNSVSVSSLPQSAAVASGYGAFGSTTTVPGNYPMNPPPPAASAATTLSYDDVLSSRYKESSHSLSLQQNENPTMWPHGHSSRTMTAVPSSMHYNYQGQNQQPGGFTQGQQQSQNYGAPGYSIFYHSQTGISLDQQQNPRGGLLGSSQGPQKQSHVWPNGY